MAGIQYSANPLENQHLPHWSPQCTHLCAAQQQEVTNHDPYQPVSRHTSSQHISTQRAKSSDPGNLEFHCMGQNQSRNNRQPAGIRRDLDRLFVRSGMFQRKTEDRDREQPVANCPVDDADCNQYNQLAGHTHNAAGL
jgi:hypothetical protein